MNGPADYATLTGATLTGTCLAGGAMLLARLDNRGAQWVGCTLFAAGVLFSTPAWADQTLMVEDNARVECVASQKDLTRISLVDDAFASVSKVQPDNPLEDFSVVNEPTRGDIYLSVPGGFKAKALSFFGTSKKGFVYKFACRIDAVEAQQIFLSNPGAAAAAKSADADESDQQAPDLDETAVRLVQAMAGQKVVPGFHMDKAALVPVRAGDVTVQLLAQYRGLDLMGRVLRIENTGKTPVDLEEAQVAPADAVAVSIASPRLEPRQVTTAYVVTRRTVPGS